MIDNEIILVDKIKTIAKNIDSRIILFECYLPKNITNKSGEALFWNLVTNIYGLFSDCSRVQIKETNNLFKLLCEYGIITRREYDFVNTFYYDISDLRSWFCHNRNSHFYFTSLKLKRIEKLIDRVFSLQSNKPSIFENFTNQEWEWMNYYIQSQYEQYFNLLESALIKWAVHPKKDELVRKWIKIYAQTLYNDSELISNVLADWLSFEMKNNMLRINFSKGINILKDQLRLNAYSIIDIESILLLIDRPSSSLEIIRESFNRIQFNII